MRKILGTLLSGLGIFYFAPANTPAVAADATDPTYTIDALSNMVTNHAVLPPGIYEACLKGWGINKDNISMVCYRLGTNGISPVEVTGLIKLVNSPDFADLTLVRFKAPAKVNLPTKANFNMAATNSDMARTNWPLAQKYLLEASANIAPYNANAPDAPDINNLTNNLNMIGTGAGEYAANLPQDRSNTNSRWGAVYLYGGAKFDNPYTISVADGKGTLQKAGSSTDGYIEFNGLTRYVFRNGDYEDPVWAEACTPWLKWFNDASTPHDGYMRIVNPLAHMPDMQGRIGFVFRQGSAPTNYSASTIVGSGDFYLDASLGFPFIRYCSDKSLWKWQGTIEFSDGFVTDKNFLALHNIMFAGAGFQGRFPGAHADLPGYWIGRAGYAKIDQPQFVSGTNSVILNSLGVPKFNHSWVPSTGVEIIYPLSQTYSLQLSGNSYYTQSPAQWNITMGLSIDLDGFFGKFPK